MYQTLNNVKNWERPLKKRYFLLIVGTVVILDQIIKLTIERTVGFLQNIVVIENFFSITHVRNKGAAFGILSSFSPDLVLPFFIILTLVALIGILYLYITMPDQKKTPLIALCLIFAGALGNFIDRLRLGEVVDFLDFHWYHYHWPAFNVADSSITIGVIIYILSLLYSRQR